MLKENDTFYIIWGQYKLTEGNKNWAHVRTQLEKERWLIVARMMFAVQHMAEKAQEELYKIKTKQDDSENN